MGRVVSWLMFAMVAVVFCDVVFRYLFSKSSVFTQELEWHLFGIVYLLAAGYTFLYDEHVRVDIMYAKLSPRGKAWLDFVLIFVMLVPSCLLVIYTSIPFVRNSFATSEGVAGSGRHPALLGAQVDDHRGLPPASPPGRL